VAELLRLQLGYTGSHDLGSLCRDRRDPVTGQIDPEDLGTLSVPVPTLEEQRGLIEAKSRVDELVETLKRIEAELAANPNNLADVNATIIPVQRALGQLNDADEVRECIRAGESKHIEFKETFSLDVKSQTKEKHIEESALKTVVAFLNSDGGNLLVGVRDDGDIAGLTPELENCTSPIVTSSSFM
jgi:hypothetical protein